MKKHFNLKKITILSSLCALACILSLLDRQLSTLLFSIFPFPFIQHFKLGLANIVILLILVNNDFKTSLLCVLIKTVMVGFIFSILMTFMISFLGSFLSFLVMYLLKKLLNKKYLIFISMIGGVTHILGQLIAIFIIYGIYQINLSSTIIIIPIFLILGLISGIIVGMITKMINQTLYQKYLGEDLNEKGN